MVLASLPLPAVDVMLRQRLAVAAAPPFSFLRRRWSCRDVLQPGAGGAGARHFLSGGPRALPVISRTSMLDASSRIAIKHEVSGCSSLFRGKIAERNSP